MRFLPLLLFFGLFSTAQTQPLASNLAAPGNGSTLLSQIEQETQGLNADIGRLRIEKWKADGQTKQQAQENANSITRNVTAALPELITAVRNSPQSLAANFKLYRNLNALYDVLSNLAETAGAFGKREEYDSLSPHVAALDRARRDYADYLLQMDEAADQRAAAAAQQARAAAATQQAPKKIIVDDTEPAPKAKKKRAKKPATAPSSTTASPPQGN